VFSGGLKFYGVDLAPLALSRKDARILLSGEGTPLMAMLDHGKGKVIALGDPWIYNEYLYTRDNRRLAEELFRYLLR
jgi:unsaturated rhamnogalacturonyl hydrolase